jgi:hypothetical protein
LAIFSRQPSRQSIVSKLSLFALLALLAGCVDYQEGLFASIEREERIPESNLPKESSVFGMVKADGKYYVSLGKLYERSTSGGDWDSIAPPPGFGDSLARDIVDIDPTDDAVGPIYVAYNDYELNGSGVFVLDTTTDTWGSGNLYTGGNEIEDIQDLFSVNGELFMSVRDSGKNYDLLWYDTSGPSWKVIVNDQTRIIAGTFAATVPVGGNVAGNSYVFLSRTDVYHIAEGSLTGSPTLSSETPESAFGASPFDNNEDFGGILYDTTNNDLYISSRQGHIYYSDGGGWTKSSNESERPYTGMAFFPQLDGNEPTGGVVVGIQDLQGSNRQTEEGGYYELPGGGVGSIVAPEGNGYATTDMSETTVIDFFVDTEPSPNALFVLTQGQGLWRGEYGNSSGALFPDPQWTHE